MLALHQFNIEKKLVLTLLGISAIALLIATAILVTYESGSIRSQQMREMNIMADIIADRTSAALVFSDANTATSNLRALAAQTSIIYACIRNENNTLFAEYKRNPADQITCASTSTKPGFNYSANAVDVYHNIMLEQKPIGLLQIRSDLSILHTRIIEVALIMLGIFILALTFTYFTSKRLVKIISGPIINLSSIASSISSSQDFSLRAKKYSNDEIGVLVDSFNNMLKHIQYRDEALHHEKSRAEQVANEAIGYADETRKSNIKLEREIEVRKSIEQKIQELNDSLEQRVKDRTTELRSLNERIGQVARSAGMAEVASGVLHNVGNVLNSVNVSASVIREMVRKSKAVNLQRVSNLLEENKHNLGDYITQDPKGVRLPEFIALLAHQLQQEHDTLIAELDVLANNIDHVKNVIGMQQSYAGSYGFLEHVAVSDLLEDALRINLEGMDKHGICIERQYITNSVINVDKHKILQILINLISNAKHSLIDSKSEPRLLQLNVTENDGQVTIIVSDNGVGIAAEDMSHLFEYGFKKRKGGHGYGLHHSALTANELSGQISVHSDGHDMGARFTLTLPINGQ